ncbi:fatty acid desaturase [Flavimaricola marinus]|uniref:Fatty acid desaturase n=1 Tax=Flavimaricola marinus TaxID=1819565 RepID=A0A238LEH7_9RHOB|nr:fatty acid desaturase [Flavimaricola marinus]SMY07992.1 Fatty acid desaturase [Flavimaricola marinus]
MTQLDHKAVLAQVSPADRARLTARSDVAGLAHLAGHVGVIVVTSALIWSGVPGWWLLLPVQGVLLVFLFTLEHECTHKTPFASARLNEAVGHLCGVVLVLPFTWFRYFHLAHHKWTNLPGQDPELDGPPIRTWAQWLRHVSGIPYWVSEIRLLGRLALGQERPAYLPEAARQKAEREARALITLYAFAVLSLFWSSAVLWLWIVPVLLGQPVLRLYLLAEHGDCPKVANMLVNSRTTFTGPVVRFLAWNMPYHAEHHAWPTVPFHQLPALHGRMQAHLGVTAKGYAAFNRAYLDRRGLLRGGAGAATPPSTPRT